MDRQDLTDRVYEIAEKLHKNRDSRERTIKSKHRDPAFGRAMRIHKRLKALEEELIEMDAEGGVAMCTEPESDRIVVRILHERVHGQRLAYLTEQEYTLLRKNPKVADLLKRCPVLDEVA